MAVLRFPRRNSLSSLPRSSTSPIVQPELPDSSRNSPAYDWKTCIDRIQVLNGIRPVMASIALRWLDTFLSNNGV